MRSLVTLTLLLSLFTAGRAVGAQPALEYEVKAAFLLNFARYVTWPSAQHRPPFRICVLGPSPFGPHLESALSGETWEGGAMELHRVQDARDGRDCHVLYVPAAATARFIASAPQLAKLPVLTIGETRSFLMRGGMIQLFVDDHKVRFSVNQASAESAGLQVSSRLLRLAREVLIKQESQP
jgi:hypothetical protein